MNSQPWQLCGQQLTLFCHVQPGARLNQFAGLYDNCIKIQLAAPPVDGKANRALIAYLSKFFARPKSAICITRGECSRRKTITIEGISQLPCELSNLEQK